MIVALFLLLFLRCRYLVVITTNSIGGRHFLVSIRLLIVSIHLRQSAFLLLLQLLLSLFDINSRLLDRLTHHIDVLLRQCSSVEKFQPLLHLFLELHAKHIGGILTETIDSRCNRTLVGQESRYTAFVLVASSTNECRVIDESILRGVAFLLQSPKQCLLGAQNLNCG